MNKFVWFLFGSVLVCINVVVGEVFSSIDKLESLVDAEKELLEELSILENDITDSLKFLNRKLTKWKIENKLASKNIQNYVTNPLNAYLMIKRLASDYELLYNRFTSDIDTFKEKMKQIVFVGDADLLSAIDGLFTLQRVYKLKTFDLAKGIIDDRATRKRLTAHDMYVLGFEGVQTDHHFYFGREFLRLAFRRIGKGRDEFEEVNEDELRKTLEGLESIVGLNPYQEEFDENVRLTDQNPQMLTEMVCRGELVKRSVETKDLQCRLVSNSPLTRISPFRVEEANFNPQILIFHDVLSNGDIDSLKNVFIEDSLALEKVSRRIEDLLGWPVVLSQDLNIQYHCLGGKSNTNLDIGSSEGQKTLATIMFFMSDVERGGASAFPYLKLKIPPKRGNALFWVRTKLSGQEEIHSTHFGCPVLQGSQRVAIKMLQSNCGNIINK